MPAVTIRFGGYQGPASVHTRGARAFGATLAELVGNEIAFECIDNVTALGRNSTDLFEMVAGDELELCYFASSYLVHRVPSLAILDLPFQVSERADMYRRLDGALGDELAAAVARSTPYRVLAWWDNGFRHFSNRLHPISGPADCQGLRIRTMDNLLHQDVFRALGFEPRFIDVKDFPAAIERHEFDAQENPLTNTVNFGIHRTHRFVSLTGHFFGATLVLVNRERFTRWPRRVQEAVGEAMADATRRQREFACAEDARCLATLGQAGVEVKGADLIDRAAFVAATRAVVEREVARLDPTLLAAMRDG